MINWGKVPIGSVLPFFFDAFDGGTGASMTLTGLAITDVEIYRGNSMTQRTSDSGVVLLDTDGIDVDGVTGIHGFSIDTGDNADAGFFVAGSFYTVVVASVTIDAQTVNFVAGTFWLGVAVTVSGLDEVDVTHWLGTAAATPTVAGVPEVDVTHWIGTAAATPTVAGVPEVDLTHVGGATTATLPGQTAPSNTPTWGDLWGFIYKNFRNKHDQTSSLGRLYADNGTTVDQKWGVSDDGTTTTLDEVVSGP